MFLFDEIDVQIGSLVMACVSSPQVLFDILELFHTNVRRISNHRVKSARRHNLRKLGLPVEDVDPQTLFFVEQVELSAFVEIGADQAVAAFDVLGQIGQGPFAE